MNELFRDFLAESVEQLEALKAQLTEERLADREACRDVWRRIHAIKAACGLLNLPRLEALAHAAETLAASLGDVTGPKDAAASLMLEAIERMGYVVVNLSYGGGEGRGDDSALIARMEPAAAPSAVSWQAACDGPPLLETPVDQASTPPERRIDNLRIPLKSIERIDALVSDLIVTQNRLLLIAAREQVARLREPLRRLTAIAGELQSEALAARLQPIGRLFANQQRLALDVAKDLGRQAQVSFEGGDAMLDRQMFGAVREALAELIRDAIDQAIEPPEERRRLGKPEAGRILVSARAEADQAVIEVRDDGRGVGDPSGRSQGGVAFARAAIEDIGGSVAWEGRPGEGATTTLIIPLAVAAVCALVVEAGADRFVVPRRVVGDLVMLDSTGARLEVVQGRLFLRAKGDCTPAARLSAMMQSPGRPTPEASQVGLLMGAGNRRFAIVVDAVTGVQDLMVKPLPGPMRHTTLFSGAAILQDGSPAFVLSATGLADTLGVDARRTRLLVVEAVQPFQRMLERTLTEAGYEVQFAATMNEALDALIHSPQFDGVLANWNEAASAEIWTRRLGAFGKAGSVRLPDSTDDGSEGADARGFACVAGEFDRGGILDALRAAGLGSGWKSAA